jgi:hypothetical protein
LRSARTTADARGEPQTFEVTHPYHPLYGQRFELVIVRHNWGEARAYYHDEKGALSSLSLEWTDLAPVEPFVQMSAGRSLFRVTDLLELSRLVAVLDGEEAG